MDRLPLPIEIDAKPFGAPLRRSAVVELPPPPTEVETEPSPDLIAALEVSLGDPLHELAALLRKMNIEQMWAFCTGIGQPNLERPLIQWAKAYMGEKVEERVATMKRRA